MVSTISGEMSKYYFYQICLNIIIGHKRIFTQCNEGLTIKTTCLRGRVTVRRRADEINFGRGVSTTDVYDEAADRN